MRVDLAKKLLAEADQKTYRVAGGCGLPSATRLAKVFRGAVCTTPGAYRKRHRGG